MCVFYGDIYINIIHYLSNTCFLQMWRVMQQTQLAALDKSCRRKQMSPACASRTRRSTAAAEGRPGYWEGATCDYDNNDMYY